VLCAVLAACAPAAAAAPAGGDGSLTPARRLSSPSVGAMSYANRVKEALRTLAQEHPEVQSARAAADTSGFEVEAAKLARYPRFKVGSATGTYDSGTDNSTSQSYQLITAEARMSLLDGGAMSAKVRAAEAGSSAQAEALKVTSQKVVLDALTAYLQVQRFDLKKQIAGKSTEVVDELSRVEERRVALGAAGENNLRMAASRRANIAARELDFEAQRAEALAKFSSYFRFAPNTEALPALAVPLHWRIASQEEALRRAESRSAELAEARERVAKARAVVDQHEASLYPTVDAVIVKSKDPRGVSPSEPTRAALELNWNFGSGFDRQLRVRSALAEVANQEAKLEGVRLNLTELTASSWSRVDSGRERERQLMEAARESGEAFRGRRRLMEFGRDTLPNVLDAQLEYYTLLLDFVDAVFDLRISEFRLARTAGELWFAPDSANTWVDGIFGPPSRAALTGDGMGVLCIGTTAPCAADSAERSPGARGLALRRAQRLSR